jgi:hypothetical protein
MRVLIAANSGALQFAAASAVGCVLAVVVIRVVRARALRTALQAWIDLPGTVLRATVHVRRAGSARQEVATIVYSYQVNGTTLQGNRTCLSSEHSTATQTVARYPVGAAVRVRVNPNDHSQSALVS